MRLARLACCDMNGSVAVFATQMDIQENMPLRACVPRLPKRSEVSR